MPEEESIVATFMKYYGDDHDKAKRGETAYSYRSATQTDNSGAYHEKCNVLNTSRLISLEGFRRLFDVVGQRSALQVELDLHDEQVQQLMHDRDV